MVGAEAGDRGQLLQARAGVEVFFDVLEDGPEPPPRHRAVPPPPSPARCRDVSDQVDGQDVGQGLGGQPPAGPARKPALANRTSRRPCCCFTGAHSRSRSARLETSPGTPVTCWPICLTASSSSAGGGR